MLPADLASVTDKVFKVVRASVTRQFPLAQVKRHHLFFDGQPAHKWVQTLVENAVLAQSMALVIVTWRPPYVRPLTFHFRHGRQGKPVPQNVPMELALHELGVLTVRAQVSLGAIVARLITPLICDSTHSHNNTVSITYKNADVRSMFHDMVRLDHALHRGRLVVTGA